MTPAAKKNKYSYRLPNMIYPIYMYRTFKLLEISLCPANFKVNISELDELFKL